MGFPGSSAGKEYTCNVADLGLMQGLGRSPGERKGYPLQYFGQENSMEDMDAFCFSVLMAKTRKYVVKARHARLLQSRFFQMGSLKT